MTFKDWIMSNHPEGDSTSGQWGPLHIAVLLGSIIAIIIIALLLRNKNEKVREKTIFIIGLCVLFFEITRRIVNTCKGDICDFNSFLYTILPRPWCAISCWLIIISVFTKKKFMYNLAATSALMNAVIFFAYPSAGFNDKHILFDNFYSISTHALLLIGSVSMITLKMTDFRYIREKDKAWKELIGLGIIYVYAFLEIYVLNIASDPLYFVPSSTNDVQNVLGVNNAVYLIIYIIFILVWFNAFYLIPLGIDKLKSKKSV